MTTLREVIFYIVERRPGITDANAQLIGTYQKGDR
jgi:hypothetical protein